MNEKRRATPYILAIITILSLAGYFSLSTLPIFQYKDVQISIYGAAMGTHGLSNSLALFIGVILSLSSLLILVISHLLILFRVKNYVKVLFNAISLPLLAIALTINTFAFPIYQYVNDKIATEIIANHYILAPQCILLLIATITDIISIFYGSLNEYRPLKFLNKKNKK